MAQLITATHNHCAIPIPALVKNNRAREAPGMDISTDNITLGIL